MKHSINLEVTISNMEIADLVNAVAVALANSTDMRNVRIHSMVVEEVED